MQKALFVFLLSTVILCSARLSQDCVVALQELEPVGQQIVRDIQERDWEQLVQDVIGGAQDIQNAAQKCLGEDATPFDLTSSSCTDDLVALLPAIERILKDVDDNNMQDLAVVVIANLQNFQDAFQACGIPYASSLHSATRSLQSTQCMEDLLSLLPYLENIVEDVRNGDIARLAGDVEAAIPTMNITYYQCIGESALVSFERLSSEQCISDIEALLPGILGLVEDIESENYTALVSDVLALVAPLEAAYADCFGAELKTIPIDNSKETEEVGNDKYGSTCLDALFYSIAYYQNIVSAYNGNDPGEIIIQTQESMEQLKTVATKCG